MTELVQATERLIIALLIDGGIAWAGWVLYSRHSDPFGLIFVGFGIACFGKNIERELLKK